MRLAPILLPLVVLLAGCNGPNPIRARALDLADVFTVAVGAGPEVSADVQATDLVHLAVGGGVHVEGGAVGRRVGGAGVVTYGLPVAPFLEDGVLHARLALDDPGGAWRTEDVQDECYVVHALALRETNPAATALQALDVEVSAFLLVGARVGFSPGELLDFLSGFVGLDPAGDG
jgi:hypothetical protein